MRRLLLTVFLWFWLMLLVVAVTFVVLAVHAGVHAALLTRFVLHDSLLFLFVGAIFCFLLSSYLTSPLRKLGEAAAGIAAGRFHTRVDPSLKRRADEIAGLARNFDLMAERIETLITAQRRLLADVSHELRSPLSRLIVALGLARQSPGDDSAEHLDRIALEARRLDALIGQLLTLSRIDTQVDRSLPARFDLATLVEEVAADAGFEARPRHARVEILRADSTPLDALEDLLRSALENVVRNAIRYTAESTAVEISLENHLTHAVLKIRDHGPGVPDAMLAEIFEPFRRVSSEATGAGLGLAIASRALAAHRGKIRAANAPGGGLVVEMTLPL